jgi:hypothetical protein
MSIEDPKRANLEGSASDAKVESGSAAGSPAPDVDAGVAWPPPEAAPGAEGDSARAGDPSGDRSGDPSADPSAAASEAKAATPGDSGVMTAPEPAAKAPAGGPAAPAGGAPAAGSDVPAAAPQEEMGLSNSTLHWLEDGDQAVPGRLTEPGTMPSYDPRAPVAGRRRAVVVVGGAGLLALIVAGSLYAQAQRRHAAEVPPAPAPVEPARDLTNRAEAALAANKIDEALDLAHLALAADARFADAHFVAATCRQSRNQPAEARDEFRKYLELAPLGTHAEAARRALTTLPP